MAWDLLFGFAGEVNFGPTFLIGTGAYTAGILDNLYQPPIWLCVAAGTLAAVIGGVVLALPALRVRGPYFGLTTLVAVLMLQNFIVVDAHLTGGENGLTVPDVISISEKTNYEIALWFMAVSGADPVRVGALAGRAHPAGERPGRRASRRARFQRHQAQAHRVHHQRILLRSGRCAAGLLRRHRLGQLVGRHHHRRADHHRRGAGRPPHHPGRGARRRSFSSP